MKNVLEEYQQRIDNEKVSGTVAWLDDIYWEAKKPLIEKLRTFTSEEIAKLSFRQQILHFIVDEKFRGVIDQKGAPFDLLELDDESIGELQALYRMSNPKERYAEIKRAIHSPESFLTAIPYKMIVELHKRGLVPYDREIFAACLIRFNVWHAAQYTKDLKSEAKEKFEKFFPTDDFTLDILMAVFEMELGVDSAFYIERDFNIGAVIMELVNRGYIKRDVIQQKLFDAFNNPTLKQTTHGWAKNIYRDLQFTSEENIVCQEQLIDLLHNDRNLLANFGISELKKIATHASFNWQLFIDSLDGVVYRDKLSGGIKNAITILLKKLKKDQSLVHQGCINIAPLFLQDDVKIQIAASKCYELLDNGDEEVKDALAPYIDTMCSEAKAALNHLIDSEELADGIFGEYEQFPYGLPCNAGNRIRYIENEEDFQYLVSRVIMSTDAIDYELFLEGLIRFYSIKNSEMKTLQPSLKQAKKLLEGSFLEYDAKHGMHHYMVAQLICIWLDPDSLSIEELINKWNEEEKKLGSNKYLPKQWVSLLTSFPRVEFVSKLIKSEQVVPLLSTPTHSNFEIDPNVLIQRLKCYAHENVTVNEDDFVIALKRLNRWTEISQQEFSTLPDSEYKEIIAYLFDDNEKSDSVKRGLLKSSWSTAYMIKNPECAVDMVLKGMSDLPANSTPWTWNLKRRYYQDYSWPKLSLSYIDDSKHYTLLYDNLFNGGIADCEHWYSKNLFLNEIFYIYYIGSGIVTDLEADEIKLMMSAVKCSALYPRPLNKAGYLLLTVTLFCSNKAVRIGAFEWLLLLIDNHYLEMQQFTDAMTKVIASEYHVFPMSRVSEQFTQLLQLRGVHVTILRKIIELTIPEMDIEKLPKSFNKIIHYYHEALLMTQTEIPDKVKEVLEKMRSVNAIKKEVKKVLEYATSMC